MALADAAAQPAVSRKATRRGGFGAGMLAGPNRPLVSDEAVVSVPRFSWSKNVEPVSMRPVRRSLVDGLISPGPEKAVVESNCVPTGTACEAPAYIPTITAAKTNRRFCIALSSN